jgi:L-lactate dehydrogenase complex protein LldG
VSTSRENILRRIKTGVKTQERTPEDLAKLQAGLNAPERGIIPSRVSLPHSELVDLFELAATMQACTVVRVASDQDAVTAVSEYLRANNLPAKVVMSPSSKVTSLPWESGPPTERRTGVARADDEVSITPVACAVAETGTMVTLSGPETPTTLNFVPENHIVIMRTGDIVGSYEDAWDRVREAGDMPRTVNWLSGPSRSADIGQTMYMGAHGPRRQHVILIEDE